MEPLMIPIAALIAAWILGALFTRALIPFMEKKQFRQFVREEGPQSHLKKTGTPSMGGIAIISSAVITALIAAAVSGGLDVSVLGVLGAMILFGLIGFVDDYEKAIKKNNLGLSPQTEDHHAVSVFGGLRRFRLLLCRRRHDRKQQHLDTGV